MQLMVDGVLHPFTEIRSYRQQHGLPPEFSTAYFEPKNYEGLGRIDQAGAALATLKARILETLPAPQMPQQWLMILPALVQRFTEELEAINGQVGLRDVEIEFAAAGYGDALMAWSYALIHAHTAHRPPPEFRLIYSDWLNSTVRLSQLAHPYAHQGELWQVRLITHVYGRIGLQVQRSSEVDYLYDARLACPAEGFMVGLISEVAAAMI